MIDGNWVDIATIIAGLIAMAVKPCIRWKYCIPDIWIHRDAINDFLNGAVIFPFLLLFSSVVSSSAMEALVKHSKISLALAGFIGSLYVAKEIAFVPKPMGPEDGAREPDTEAPSVVTKA